jgi:putative membrane protein
MDPIKGAVAGAIGGAAGAYTMELFQSWWNGAEERLAPKRQAHAAKDTVEKSDDPATLKAANRIAKKTLDTEVPVDDKAAAGDAVHYSTGATIGAIYGFVADILPPARMFNGLLMGTIVWWTADNMAVPAQGLGKTPGQTPPSKHAYELSSHLVYGFTTELVRSVVRMVI